MADAKVSPLSTHPQFTAANKLDRSVASEAGEGKNDLLLENESAGSPAMSTSQVDPLCTPEQIARRLNVSADWVRDHSSRKEPRLPVIRLGGGPGRAGLLRYRASQIEKFIAEMERLSSRNSRRL